MWFVRGNFVRFRNVLDDERHSNDGFFFVDTRYLTRLLASLYGLLSGFQLRIKVRNGRVLVSGCLSITSNANASSSNQSVGALNGLYNGNLQRAFWSGNGDSNFLGNAHVVGRFLYNDFTFSLCLGSTGNVSELQNRARVNAGESKDICSNFSLETSFFTTFRLSYLYATFFRRTSNVSGHIVSKDLMERGERINSRRYVFSTTNGHYTIVSRILRNSKRHIFMSWGSRSRKVTSRGNVSTYLVGGSNDEVVMNNRRKGLFALFFYFLGDCGHVFRL